MRNKDRRPGEELWREWSGSGFNGTLEDAVEYFTVGDVDVNNEIVYRALASSLQRDGVAQSLGEGFRLLESSIKHKIYAGILSDEDEYVVCNESGETHYGDSVVEVLPIHVVEIPK